MTCQLQPDTNPDRRPDISPPSSAKPIKDNHSLHLSTDQITWGISITVFLFALILYGTTMCRTVFWWDSGELAANASILGIPHRPGFPLYILMARVLGMAPLGDFFYRVNFLSVLCAATAASLLTYTAIRLLLRYATVGRSAIYSALLAASAFILTYTFWIQAVRAEVYALNALVISVVLLLVERADAAAGNNDRQVIRCLYAATFLFGLGLGGHHATLASAAPAIIILAIVILGRRILRPGFLIVAVAFFAAGLSVYLYLPIRALQSPLLNWGWSSGSLADGAQSVMATDSYKYFALLTIPQVIHKFFLAVRLISDQIGQPLALLSALGLLFWFTKSKRWASFFVLLAFGNLLVVAIMATEFIDWNADLHGYLLPTLVAMVFGMGVGFLLILNYTVRFLDRLVRPGHLRLIARTCLIAIAILLALTPGMLGGPFCNLSENRLAYDLGSETLIGLPRGSVIIMDGVNWNFVLRGLQFGTGLRPDVAVINRSFMPVAWYQKQCRQRYPDLLTGLEFPSSTASAEIIAWAETFRAGGRPVFWEITEEDLPYFRRFRPAGHMYRLAEPDSMLTDSLIFLQEHFERTSGFYGATDALRYDFDAQGIYIHNLYRAGLFYERWGLLYRAKELYRRALSVRPAEEILQTALARVEKTVTNPLHTTDR